tara:strand:+ start:893 stop:1216 length:324 start_codon:yes stop_codon:yes gene_type:complete
VSLKLTKKSSDLEYVEELQPKNISEKEISKMFGISYTMLKTQRNGEAFDTDICFTVKGSAKILYNIEKFEEWFNKNKWIANINFNARIRELTERLNSVRKRQGLPKL